LKLFDSTKIPLLGRALDAYTLRHRTISSNIANIGSAGYRPGVVSFEEQLAASRAGQNVTVTTTDPRHIAVGAQSPSDVTPVVHEAPGDPRTKLDPNASGVNGVDIDNEMAELAKNQIRFKYAARLLAGTFKEIQESIRGTE
jgi:flagellar basal-body rod protein FlgB